MSENYAKLDQDIVYSTLWREDAETCKLWITFLALKDGNGVVSKNLVGIALIAGIELERCLVIVEKFCAPDPLSTSKEHEGRRLLKVSEGYWVVNHEKYRATGSEYFRKEQGRIRMQRFREKHGLTRGGTVPNCPPASPNVPVSPPPPVPPKTPKEAKTPPLDCVVIFTELNDLTGSKFRPEGSALAMLAQRLAQADVTADGVLQMVRRQVKLWKDDPKMSQFLRPTTLFNQTKFNEYYAAREQPIPVNVRTGNGQSPKIIAPVRGSEPVGGF